MAELRSLTFVPMGRAMFLSILLCCLMFHMTHSSVCTDKCDASGGNGTKWVWCGTDGLTHNTTSDAVISNHCYAFCGVSVVHVGPCGCPNNCGGHGSCSVESKSCVCDEGFGGADCVDVACPGNTCGGHGMCIDHPTGDYCSCQTGYTGTYCDVPVLGLTWPLWPDVLPNSPPPYFHDKYRDNHPLINMNVIGTLHIELPEDQYVQMILPQK